MAAQKMPTPRLDFSGGVTSTLAVAKAALPEAKPIPCTPRSSSISAAAGTRPNRKALTPIRAVPLTMTRRRERLSAR